MREATVTRYASLKRVIQDRSYMKWAYPLWNEVLCIVIPVEIIIPGCTLHGVTWPQTTVSPHYTPLVRILKLTCCRLGYLQCPENYGFVMSGNSKHCS